MKDICAQRLQKINDAIKRAAPKHGISTVLAIPGINIRVCPGNEMDCPEARLELTERKKWSHFDLKN